MGNIPVVGPNRVRGWGIFPLYDAPRVRRAGARGGRGVHDHHHHHHHEGDHESEHDLDHALDSDHKEEGDDDEEAPPLVGSDYSGGVAVSEGGDTKGFSKRSLSADSRDSGVSSGPIRDKGPEEAALESYIPMLARDKHRGAVTVVPGQVYRLKNGATPKTLKP